MGQPKTGKNNNLNLVFGNTGTNVVKTNKNTGKQEIMHKTTGDKAEEKGLAKASPAFKEVKPDDKVVASKDAQKKALEENTIDNDSDDDQS